MTKGKMFRVKIIVPDGRGQQTASMVTSLTGVASIAIDTETGFDTSEGDGSKPTAIQVNAVSFDCRWVSKRRHVLATLKTMMAEWDVQSTNYYENGRRRTVGIDEKKSK